MLNEYNNMRVAYRSSDGDFMLSLYEYRDWYDASFWHITDKKGNVLAWGQDYEGTCPMGSDDTWIIGDFDSRESLKGFKMTSDDYEKRPVEEPNGRCWFSDDYVHHCEHQGQFRTHIYGVSEEECLKRCSNDYPDCVKVDNLITEYIL